MYHIGHTQQSKIVDIRVCILYLTKIGFMNYKYKREERKIIALMVSY